MKDKRLISKIQFGNEEQIHKVFNEIYVTYGKIVFFVISKYVHQLQDVEDLTNDVFLSFFNQIQQIDLKNNIKSYLTASAKNKVLNFISKRHNQIEASESIFLIPDKNNKNSYYLLLKEMEECLSKEEIEIILNHSVEGMRFKSIATELKKPTNSIITTYHRAIKKFKKYKDGR
ncbi:MAG: sigma-70 family RNA polymerase sigma factor [Roseburia sp.]|nr:sigma-70 family RNA polymerase sigma factor [Anaeroplasma bactoclasticum]MCM1197124.1 sigma-70 family RNA polymerase sigma factor [Roseburia sp.]MCM1556750.1 sigma-70 family RNA polymerase sigma factor [Anaeroplasma bactoclasticum]